MTASNPCFLYTGSIVTNSWTFRSGSHCLVSGYAQRSRVGGFRSSKVACTMRELRSKPSIRQFSQVCPAYVGAPSMKKSSPRISTRVKSRCLRKGLSDHVAGRAVDRKFSDNRLMNSFLS